MDFRGAEVGAGRLGAASAQKVLLYFLDELLLESQRSGNIVSSPLERVEGR